MQRENTGDQHSSLSDPSAKHCVLSFRASICVSPDREGAWGKAGNRHGEVGRNPIRSLVKSLVLGKSFHFSKRILPQGLLSKKQSLPCIPSPCRRDAFSVSFPAGLQQEALSVPAFLGAAGDEGGMLSFFLPCSVAL